MDAILFSKPTEDEPKKIIIAIVQDVKKFTDTLIDGKQTVGGINRQFVDFVFVEDSSNLNVHDELPTDIETIDPRVELDSRASMESRLSDIEMMMSELFSTQQH